MGTSKPSEMAVIVPPSHEHLYGPKRAPLVTIPSPALRQVAKEIHVITDIGNEFVATMRTVMKQGNGVGLAGPQIGWGYRVIMLQIGKLPFTIVINPVLSNLSEEKVTTTEGCLSIPKLFGDVERHASCTLKGFNSKGNALSLDLEGPAAIVAQHEVDHLNGILFVDRANPSTLYWGVVR